MSREQFTITSNKIQECLRPGILRNSRSSDTKTKNMSASYHNIVSGNLQGNYNILSTSKANMDANMPIFMEDTRDTNVLSNRRNFNLVAGPKSGSSGMHNSSALETLQNYGSGTKSPIHSPQWNTDYDPNCSGKKYYDIRQSSEIQGYQMHDTVSSDVACKPFNDLNLKTVDEEDAFLYGDSNSLPEAPKSAMKEPIKTNNTQLNTGWSDDEDPCDVYVTDSVGFHVKRTPSIWDTRNKHVESTKLSENRQDEILNRGKLFSTKPSNEQFHSPAMDRDVVILSEKNDGQNSDHVIPNKASNNTVGTKSKYHVAAAILKNQAAEKSKLINKSSSGDVFSGSHKIMSNTEKFISNSSKSYEREKSDLKSDKSSSENQKRLSKSHLLQKDLDNIKDYIKPPSDTFRKRTYPQEEFGPDSKRHESSRNALPSRYSVSDSKCKSTYDYRHRSPVHHSRNKSPDSDYRRAISPYHSRHKSPNYEKEYYSRHRSYEGRTRHSYSPGRRSHDKSPTYNRYKARDSGSHRSRERSRSPTYHSSRDRSYDSTFRDRGCDKSQKSYPKSHKTSEHYSKSKQSRDFSSDSSHIFDSLDSISGSSCGSADENLGKKDKNSSKRLSSKTVSQSDRKNDKDTEGVDVIDILSNNTESSNTKYLDENLSKNLCDIFNLPNETVKDSKLSNEKFDSLNNEAIIKMLQSNEIITQAVEGIQQGHSSMFSASSIPGSTSIVSNSDVPSMTCAPQSYSYPSMPNVPMYLTPRVHNFPPVLPPDVFPPTPSMPPVLTTVHDPYDTSIDFAPSCKSKSPKSRQFRKANSLRSIPLTGSSDISSVDKPTSVTSKSQKSTTTSFKLKSSLCDLSKQTSDKKEKESDTHVTSTSKPTVDNNAEIISKFKKMKADRHIAHCRMNSAVQDLVEMRNTLDNTFVKKVNASEKIIQVKCKNSLNVTSDSITNFVNDAKQKEEELSRFKASLPKELQVELSKIKLEQCKEETVCKEIYTCFDSGDHLCFFCNKQFKTISNMVEHLHTSEHKVNTATDVDWMKHFQNEIKKPDDIKKCVPQSVKGIEFLKPVTGFFCDLCKETLVDNANAEQHVKTHDHYLNYKNFMKLNPMHERKMLFKRYILHSVSSLRLRTKEMEEKKKLSEERKKSEAAAEKRVKEMIKNEKNTQMNIVELKDEDSEDIPACGNQISSNIKLNLAGEKDKTNARKFSYIGKAPNFKKRKCNAWYKRDSILNAKESESDPVIPSPAIMSTSERKDSVLEMKRSALVNESQASRPATKGSTSSGHSQICDPKLSGVDFEKSATDNKDQIVKQAIKNILLGSDSDVHKDVTLSDIQLPQISPKQTSSSAHIPVTMDINAISKTVSQDIEKVKKMLAFSKPKSKVASEEEKDFFILGINKDDLKPLVVPVPPPSTMLSHSNSSSTSTYLSANAGCSTEHTVTTDISHNIKNLDFSVPPPSIQPYQNNVPSVQPYQNNTPSMQSYQSNMHLYGNSNTQTAGLYSYPNNDPSVGMYSNSSNMHSISPFSNPPPMHPYTNPPPMIQYPNPSNVSCMPQFHNANNMPPMGPFPNMLSGPHQNPHNNPSMYSVPNVNQHLHPTSVQSNVQTYMPTSMANSSFNMYNANMNTGSPNKASNQNNTDSDSPKKQLSKSPTPANFSGRTLITIIPTEDSITINEKESLAKSDKSAKQEEKTSGIGATRHSSDKKATVASSEPNAVERDKKIEDGARIISSTTEVTGNDAKFQTDKNAEILSNGAKEAVDEAKANLQDDKESETASSKINETSHTEVSPQTVKSVVLENSANVETNEESSKDVLNNKDEQQQNRNCVNSPSSHGSSVIDNNTSTIEKDENIKNKTEIASNVIEAGDKEAILNAVMSNTSENVVSVEIIERDFKDAANTDNSTQKQECSSDKEAIPQTVMFETSNSTVSIGVNEEDSKDVLSSGENIVISQLVQHSGTETNDKIVMEPADHVPSANNPNNVSEMTEDRVCKADNISPEVNLSNENSLEMPVLDKCQEVTLQTQNMCDMDVEEAAMEKLSVVERFSLSNLEKTKSHDTLDQENVPADQSWSADSCSDSKFENVRTNYMQDEKISVIHNEESSVSQSSFVNTTTNSNLQCVKDDQIQNEKKSVITSEESSVDQSLHQKLSVNSSISSDEPVASHQPSSSLDMSAASIAHLTFEHSFDYHVAECDSNMNMDVDESSLTDICSNSVADGNADGSQNKSFSEITAEKEFVDQAVTGDLQNQKISVKIEDMTSVNQPLIEHALHSSVLKSEAHIVKNMNVDGSSLSVDNCLGSKVDVKAGNLQTRNISVTASVKEFVDQRLADDKSEILCESMDVDEPSLLSEDNCSYPNVDLKADNSQNENTSEATSKESADESISNNNYQNLDVTNLYAEQLSSTNYGSDGNVQDQNSCLNTGVQKSSVNQPSSSDYSSNLNVENSEAAGIHSKHHTVTNVVASELEDNCKIVHQTAPAKQNLNDVETLITSVEDPSKFCTERKSNIEKDDQKFLPTDFKEQEFDKQGSSQSGNLKCEKTLSQIDQKSVSFEDVWDALEFSSLPSGDVDEEPSKVELKAAVVSGFEGNDALEDKSTFEASNSSSPENEYIIPDKLETCSFLKSGDIQQNTSEELNLPVSTSDKEVVTGTDVLESCKTPATDIEAIHENVNETEILPALGESNNDSDTDEYANEEH